MPDGGGRRRFTIQRILQRHFPRFERAHLLPEAALHAARRIIKCRTPEIGSHRQSCPNGHYSVTQFNSCRHRSCPQCGRIRVTRWLAGVERRLLPCPHYHVVFTIPHELNALWLANPRLMTQLLFAAARETLFEMLADSRHLGACPGVLASLHTWGRTLIFHPHLHCLVTAGGVIDSGTWRAETRGFLLPVKAASVLFRGKLLHALRHQLRRGRLVLPRDIDATAWSRLVSSLYAKKWQVYIKERYDRPHHVLAYLGRYLRGGPLGNSRLVAVTRHAVAFRYTNHRAAAGSARQTVMQLAVAEFLRRLLMHVPIPGMQLIRSYGLYANAKHTPLSGLPAGEPEAAAPSTALAPEHNGRCPACGARLQLTLYPRPVHSPSPRPLSPARASPRTAKPAA